MIHIAMFRYACRENGRHGEFTYLVDACSQEDAELQLMHLLSEAVKNADWFPAPCRILLSQLAVIDSFPPPGGMIIHLRRGFLDASYSGFPLKHFPSSGVRMLHDWDTRKIDDPTIPQPLFEVRRDRSISVISKQERM